MKHPIYALLFSLSTLLMACDNAAAPYQTSDLVTVTLQSDFGTLGTQGVPYDPATNTSGVSEALLRVFDGDEIFDVSDFGDFPYSYAEFFFDADGKITTENKAVEQIVSESTPSRTLQLPPGNYAFVLDARDLAIGSRFNETISGGESLFIPMVSYIGGGTLSDPVEVVPGESYDIFLQIHPPGRPDLQVPVGDYNFFEVDVYAGDGYDNDIVIDSSDTGLRLAATCEEVAVSGLVYHVTEINDINLDDSIVFSRTYPAGTFCSNKGVDVSGDLTPPTVFITSPADGAATSGKVKLKGKVSDAQSGVDRVEVYDGPFYLGSAKIDKGAGTWSYKVTPSEARNYTFVVLAHDVATNEGRAKVSVSATP